MKKGVWDALQGEDAMQILVNALASIDNDKAVDILLEKAKRTLSALQLLKLNDCDNHSWYILSMQFIVGGIKNVYGYCSGTKSGKFYEAFRTYA